VQKWYDIWFQKTLFLSEPAAVYFFIGQNLISKNYKQPSTSLAMTSQLRHSML